MVYAITDVNYQLRSVLLKSAHSLQNIRLYNSCEINKRFVMNLLDNHPQVAHLSINHCKFMSHQKVETIRRYLIDNNRINVNFECVCDNYYRPIRFSLRLTESDLAYDSEEDSNEDAIDYTTPRSDKASEVVSTTATAAAHNETYADYESSDHANYESDYYEGGHQSSEYDE